MTINPYWQWVEYMEASIAGQHTPSLKGFGNQTSKEFEWMEDEG